MCESKPTAPQKSPIPGREPRCASTRSPTAELRALEPIERRKFVGSLRVDLEVFTDRADARRVAIRAAHGVVSRRVGYGRGNETTTAAAEQLLQAGIQVAILATR